MNYSIISSVKNEDKFIIKTLDSVVKQTVLPNEWIIINDGSTDKTSEIIELYQTQFPWIIKIDLHDFRPEIKSTGGRVAHILNMAAKKLTKDFDLIVKLDGDVEFNSAFFDFLINEFVNDKELGIASGNLVFEGNVESIDYLGNTVRGAVLIIKKEIFENTMGFFQTRNNGEDTLFGVAARFWGFKTKTFPVFFNHLKPEGERDTLLFKSYITGFYKGSIPYRFDYFLLTLVKHSLKQPIVIGSLVQLIGYVKARFIEKYKPYPYYIEKQLNIEQWDYLKAIFCNKKAI